MRFRLLVLGVLLGTSCWPTGANTASGMAACEQLRDCWCDPSKSPDPAGCNAAVDLLIGLGPPTNAQQCTALMLNPSQFSGTSGFCGQPLRVTNPTF